MATRSFCPADRGPTRSLNCRQSGQRAVSPLGEIGLQRVHLVAPDTLKFGSAVQAVNGHQPLAALQTPTHSIHGALPLRFQRRNMSFVPALGAKGETKCSLR